MAAWRDMGDGYDRAESYGQHVSSEAFYPDLTFDQLCAVVEDATTDLERLAGELVELARLDREDWPVHQPGPAYEAPIPGLHWYGGCEPDHPRVNPLTGRCEGCGETACGVCGRSINEAHQGCEVTA